MTGRIGSHSSDRRNDLVPSQVRLYRERPPWRSASSEWLSTFAERHGGRFLQIPRIRGRTHSLRETGDAGRTAIKCIKSDSKRTDIMVHCMMETPHPGDLLAPTRKVTHQPVILLNSKTCASPAAPMSRGTSAPQPAKLHQRPRTSSTRKLARPPQRRCPAGRLRPNPQSYTPAPPDLLNSKTFASPAAPMSRGTSAPQPAKLHASAPGPAQLEDFCVPRSAGVPRDVCAPTRKVTRQRPRTCSTRKLMRPPHSTLVSRLLGAPDRWTHAPAQVAVPEDSKSTDHESLAPIRSPCRPCDRRPGVCRTNSTPGPSQRFVRS